MLLSQKRLLGLFLTLAPAVTLAVPINFGFPYGQQKVRGVNLGGWLVLEVSFQFFGRRIIYSNNISLSLHPLSLTVQTMPGSSMSTLSVNTRTMRPP